MVMMLKSEEDGGCCVFDSGQRIPVLAVATAQSRSTCTYCYRVITVQYSIQKHSRSVLPGPLPTDVILSGLYQDININHPHINHHHQSDHHHHHNPPKTDLLASTPPHERVLIGIAGIPGSGKTTLANRLVSRINSLSPPSTSTPGPVALMLPMDGFHLPRSVLLTFPDPSHALFRRGAPFTFDPSTLLTLLRDLSPPHPQTSTLTAPSFSHKEKDPVFHAISIHPPPLHRLVVVEGLYLALKQPIWRDINALFRETWFVDTPRGVAKARLVRRHVEAGICASEEEAGSRADRNDLVNGEMIVAEQGVVHRVVRGWFEEEEGWGAA